LRLRLARALGWICGSSRRVRYCRDAQQCRARKNGDPSTRAWLRSVGRASTTIGRTAGATHAAIA